MGREIRHVPPDWEHPRYGKNEARTAALIGQFKPLFDEDWQTACQQWVDKLEQWRRDNHGLFNAGGWAFWECEASPPNRDSYRERQWSAADATHMQLYETVSEGTPVTPHFATADELIDYLVRYGDFWDQKRGDGGWSRAAAERMAKSGWAPSMIAVNGVVQTPKDMDTI